MTTEKDGLGYQAIMNCGRRRPWTGRSYPTFIKSAIGWGVSGKDLTRFTSTRHPSGVLKTTKLGSSQLTSIRQRPGVLLKDYDAQTC